MKQFITILMMMITLTSFSQVSTINHNKMNKYDYNGNLLGEKDISTETVIDLDRKIITIKSTNNSLIYSIANTNFKEYSTTDGVKYLTGVAESMNTDGKILFTLFENDYMIIQVDKIFYLIYSENKEIDLPNRI